MHDFWNFFTAIESTWDKQFRMEVVRKMYMWEYVRAYVYTYIEREGKEREYELEIVEGGFGDERSIGG